MNSVPANIKNSINEWTKTWFMILKALKFVLIRLKHFNENKRLSFCLNFKYRTDMTCTFHASSTPKVQTKS